MKKFKLHKILNNFSAYELCFIIENLIFFLITYICKDVLINYVSNVFIDVLRKISIILIIYLIAENIVDDRKSKQTINTCYKGEKYFILPINTVKTITINIINILLFINSFYKLKYFIFIFIIVNILYLACIKYYITLINVRKGIINNE